MKEKHAKAIEKHEGQVAELNELLAGEVEFNGTKIGLADVPQSIEPAVMEVFILADLIKEEE